MDGIYDYFPNQEISTGTILNHICLIPSSLPRSLQFSSSFRHSSIRYARSKEEAKSRDDTDERLSC